MTAIAKLARALQRACDEHGRPNSFTCGELEDHYGGPPAMLAGQIGASGATLAKLHDALGGAPTWGAAPRYTGGRWVVSAPVDARAS